MDTSIIRIAASALSVAALAACSSRASQPIEAGYGPNPVLPAPHEQWIPKVHIAEAHGWPQGVHPVAAPGM